MKYELTIEQVIAYLPYKVKVITNDNDICEITGFNGESVILDNNIQFRYDLDSIKLILKPLPKNISDCICEFERIVFRELEKVCFDYRDLPTKLYLEMLEYHYDVFQLIDDNLAVTK